VPPDIAVPTRRSPGGYPGSDKQSSDPHHQVAADHSHRLRQCARCSSHLDLAVLLASMELSQCRRCGALNRRAVA
jgi:hypothetical protein